MNTMTTIAIELHQLTLVCAMPADFADVEELLQGLDAEQRSLYWAAGYTAYLQGRGPGRGREEALGWLAAHHDTMTELQARAQDRDHRLALAWGLV